MKTNKTWRLSDLAREYFTQSDALSLSKCRRDAKNNLNG